MNGKTRGFTLIELIVVVTIIGILAAMAIPAMRQAPIRAKEAALKHNLFTLRNVIDQYYADHAAYPQGLEDLVSEGYLRAIPIDPITEQTDWEVIYMEEEDADDWSAGGDFAPPGIWDVHSASGDIALDGTPYAEW
ncbi:MAG TPA: prepilin-type N-terminal cleavage/methylation domain-containing protein [Thermoanaerobaculia bacterium]|nr:prepilin-type N-terminal cleavage/methylation domain-containing protein [Thermoanaerobaculia bacterium]HUM31293.1 prepilin-type N-terminal cleavage/methylation domain-containing protein [Thermoanaerobaculia bacterium]HXK69636.1 prepilin-type N-terminal cleavage/methylation domain-containing protein [Thermoanaerobaculia bacterium]